jgi:hypothetical protein
MGRNIDEEATPDYSVRLRLDFPISRSNDTRQAYIGRWTKPSEYDITVIHTEEELPVQPVFGRWRESERWKEVETVSSFGVPIYDSEGGWVDDLSISGSRKWDAIQLSRPNTTGSDIVAGFSGGPVVSQRQGQFVLLGIVTKSLASKSLSVMMPTWRIERILTSTNLSAGTVGDNLRTFKQRVLEGLLRDLDKLGPTGLAHQDDCDVVRGALTQAAIILSGLPYAGESSEATWRRAPHQVLLDLRDDYIKWNSANTPEERSRWLNRLIDHRGVLSVQLETISRLLDAAGEEVAESIHELNMSLNAVRRIERANFSKLNGALKQYRRKNRGSGGNGVVLAS